MKLFYRFSAILTLFLLLTLMVSLQAAAQPAEGGGLFADAGISDDAALEVEPTIMRNRLVTVNFDLLGGLHAPVDTIFLNLFGDTTFVATFDRAETNALGSFAWFGHIEGVAFSQVNLVVTNGLLAGSVSMPDSTYQIIPQGESLHAVRQIDQSAFPPELEPISIAAPGVAPAHTAAPQTDPCDQITVLVPYTPEARAAAGGTAAMQSLIALAVAETNQSYVNSGLGQRLNLVHTMETAPGDAQNDFYDDLYALQFLSDGVFNEVDAARETYYADVVALIIENGASCGLGFLNSTASTAFSVTHRTCATGYYSFGHEIGHNMGAHHDWYVEGTLFYNKGFVNLADSWRTIMAYNTLCSDHGSGYCTRLQYWSNPDVSYGSPADPMGVSSSGPTNCVAGSTSPNPSSCAADNRTRLNSTCSAVANFRNQPTQTGAIIVEKQSDPDGDAQSFTFTGDAAGTISDGEQIVVSDLPAGTYTSQEAVVDGWRLTDISCDDGNSTGNVATRTVTFALEAGETVICTFTNEKEAYTLNVNTSGDGLVTLDPEQPTYSYGDTVELTAAPDAGWLFAGWSGDASGISEQTTITMNGNKAVTATFTQADYTLTVDVVGNGSVTIDPDLATYNYGENVILTPIAEAGWKFVEWGGDVTGTANPAVITIDGDKNVTVTFGLKYVIMLPFIIN